MFRLFECCALSFFERFVLSFSLKIERFVSDSAEIWICGLYICCSVTATLLQYYCKYMCSVTANRLQRHCKKHAVSLQWEVSVYQ